MPKQRHLVCKRSGRISPAITWPLTAIVCALLAVTLFLFVRKDSELPQDSAAASLADSTRPQSSDQSEASGVMPQTTNGKARAERIEEGLVPSVAEWPTEAFSESAAVKLKRLGKYVSVPGMKDRDLRFMLSPEFKVGLLRPTNLESVMKSGQIEVLRSKENGPFDEESAPDSQDEVHGRFTEAFTSLFEGVIKDARAAFKIVRVSRIDDGFQTVVYAEGGGTTEQGRTQWTATWSCRWTDDALLKAVVVTDYEEVRCTGPKAWLVDATANVLGTEPSYATQLMYGMDYWVNKLEHRLYPNRLGHHGLAIGDIDGDGLEDLYVCQPGGLPNRLYVHRADGTAVDKSAQAGVNILDDTTAALFADFDNDGDQDLALLTVSGGHVLENNGKGVFAVRASLPQCRNAFSLTAADYDRDGKLDLYIGKYWPDESGRGAIPLPVPYYDALNGGGNLLLRNAGPWEFRDVTTEVGLDVDNTRYTMAAAWEDFDNDGDQDLYVANDFGRNCLYRNDDGVFKNVAPEAGVEDTAAGMSVSWSDFNHDGNMDAYIGNMFSSAGGRITYQRQYSERFVTDAQAKLQRLARGNSLFSNTGDGFEDVSLAAAVTMGRWAWGSIFTDLNNDSWDDLIVANGHVSTEDAGDL